jgi:phospholipid/cholesterol/gamma-HCH transport system substrate-binding protein
MRGMLARVNGRAAAIAVALILIVAAFLVLRQPEPKNEVTAHFPRAVSVYKGTDVRVLGVNVGRVTAVIPEGNSVRVEMEYDAEIDLPADAKAAIITPTLVADRFVQLTPVYTEGPKLKDGADIPLPDTGVPVELDRIYASLRDLSETLGPNGVNADGTLDHLLAAGTNALEGNGALGNEMLTNLAGAAQTFGEGSGPLFDTVTELAHFTDTLASNDALVRAFVKDLAGVSGSLRSERDEIQRALASVARAVGTVKTFVQSNRKALVTDLQKLTRVMKTINSERDSIDDALTVAPVAINNLVLAYDTKSGSVGSRIGIQQNIWDADGFLCAIVQQSDMPKVSKDLACQIFEALLEPVTSGASPNPRPTAGGTARTASQQQSSGRNEAAATQARYAIGDDSTLRGLLGGGS